MSKLQQALLIISIRCRSLQISIEARHTIGLVILLAVAFFLMVEIWFLTVGVDYLPMPTIQPPEGNLP